MRTSSIGPARRRYAATVNSACQAGDLDALAGGARAIPNLPLTTEAGACNVLLHPVGAPADYDEMLGDATRVELDNVPALIPTIDALLDGLAGGARQPHPELIARLLQQGARSRSNEAVAAWLTSPPEAERDDDVEQAILLTVEHLRHPASIRDPCAYRGARYWLKTTTAVSG